MTKRYVWAAIFCALTVAWLAFIWGNSMTTGVESGEMSGSVTDWINDVLQKIHPSFRVGHTFVRKSAHFFEFALLGTLFAATIHTLFWRKKDYFVFLAIGSSFLSALTDELIQMFTDGRVASLVDVTIDTLGASVAVLIFFAVLTIKKAGNKKIR